MNDKKKVLIFSLEVSYVTDCDADSVSVNVGIGHVSSTIHAVCILIFLTAEPTPSSRLSFTFD